MVGHDRIRVQQIERQAEGYLELAMPQSALDTLGRVRPQERLSARGYYLQGEALRTLERYEEALVPLEKAKEMLNQEVPPCTGATWR